MKPYIAHYANKYPGGSVDSDGHTYLRAHDAKGRLRVALIMGAGSVQDQSKMLGAMDQHDLGPIPKDCRVFCDGVDGMHRHAHADARAKVAEQVAAEFDGRVPSVEEMCGEDFQNSHKWVDAFRAEVWLGGEVVQEQPKQKIKAKVKSK